MSLAETTETLPTPTPPGDATQTVWAAREGASDHAKLVYDSSNAIILSFDEIHEFPGNASVRHEHLTATKHWAQQHNITLPESDVYLFLEPTLDTDWSHHVAEKYECPLSMLNYTINFNDAKWNQYDVSVSSQADIPGVHGTLRKELKVQGFATHRPNAVEEVRLWMSLTHLETDHVFYEDTTETYQVPEAQSYKSYPLVPAVLVSIYNNLFTEVSEYTELLTDTFTVCERCGVYDKTHSEQGVTVMQAIDPNGGWARQYCTDCYAQVISNEYGVLNALAQLYIQHEQGATHPELADAYGESESYVSQMIARVDDAVKRGRDF